MTARARQPKPLDEAALWNYALKSLGGRALSISEMRQRLRRRAEPAVDIDAVLAKLREYGYLDDRQFAETFANSGLNNRGLGKMRVLRDLRQRRVAPSLAEESVNKTFSEVDEVALIEKYLARKFRSVAMTEHLADPKNLASVYRRLRYAGFSPGNSINVLKRYAARAEELEGLEE